jgi:HD-like signal output (HDOD) protein
MTIPDALQKQLHHCTSIISLPAIAIEVINMAENPDIGLADVEKVIRNDPALSAKLVRVANSPLFARSKNIESILQALTLLGLDSALSLTLSFSLMDALKSKNGGIDSQKLWRRTIISAIIGQELGHKISIQNPGALFLSCLLQDIGMLVLFQLNAEKYQEILTKSDNHSSLIELEQDAFGCDHADIGAHLTQSWHLPALIVDTIQQSHDISSAKNLDEAQKFQCCVSLSGPIADIWIDELKHSYTDVITALANLDISDEQLNELIEKVLGELPALSHLFDVELIDSNEIHAILEKSREVLMIRDIQSKMQQKE